MYHYEMKRKKLLDQCRDVHQLIEEKLPNSVYKATLSDLQTDLEADGQMITVLGEFKRGKSTLLNSLIRTPLLPADVTPTTATINVIKHNEKEKIEIHMQNGEVVKKNVRHDVLRQFTFEGGNDLQSIHHIDIELPLHNLDQSVILVDTPGVGDLNEHRLDVTYSYIPRSSIILFVLDATTPIRKTEIDYLKDTVVKLKFGEVIFVANFIDRLDEEELEEAVEYMGSRLKKIMGNEPFKLFPLSSKEALSNPDDQSFHSLISYLNHQLNDGEAGQKKMDFFEARMTAIFNQLSEEINAIESIKAASLKDLEDAQQQLVNFKAQTSDHAQTLSEYISNRKGEIVAIVFKSVNTLKSEIQESVKESIFLFEGTNFQTFIEKKVPLSVKNRTKQWINQYTPQIDTLIKKLEIEILKGFSELFQKEMNALNLQHSTNRLEGINLQVKTKSGSSDTTITSGLITAGSGAILAIASGGILLPFISMAGFPMLNKLLHAKKLTQLKEEVNPLLEKEIHQVTERLKSAIHQYIDQEISHLEEKALNRFKEYVISYEQNLELESNRRSNETMSTLPTIKLKELILIKHSE